MSNLKKTALYCRLSQDDGSFVVNGTAVVGKEPKKAL